MPQILTFQITLSFQVNFHLALRQQWKKFQIFSKPGFPFPPENQGKNSRICPNFNVSKLRLVFKMANGLVDSAISTVTKVISCFLPIDDTEELCYDLQNDELVKHELSNIAGLLVVRGGRLVALGSALSCKLQDI